MGNSAGNAQHIQNLRRWRNRSSKDLSLAGLSEFVRKNVVKPHSHLGGLAQVWQEMIPQKLRDRTGLVSLNRGVLTVHVSDSAAMYELDRLLRSGVEQRVRQACGATLRRIRCRVAPV